MNSAWHGVVRGQEKGVKKGGMKGLIDLIDSIRHTGFSSK